ncbi:ribonuclease HII [Halalkalicoccus paucihalophilus]|uniref:Ribonuclease HII n=1 Tax=Halalkalicoccus paucihalophilus TaxID=1008153 RepID=A0A151AET7_9EURY|nr:ribonuclease HII [Halalkalicoccus paucihalophilus]KYH26179.1 ribonuclease HII [Halalkalicoccus paucihalophilus]
MERFGIDEAGKGPVLGPMVAACVVAPEGALPEGIDDSKRLAPARREELARRLRKDDRITVGFAAVTPDRIDAPDTDMNTLTVAAHAEAAREVVERGMTGICDAGDVNAARFVRRVGEHLPEGVALDGEHGADGNHVIVGAASVVAKVERDRRVRELESEYGEVGSGYPSDPRTRAFLAEYVAEHGDLPACARSSWKTCADVLAAAEQETLAEF